MSAWPAPRYRVERPLPPLVRRGHCLACDPRTRSCALGGRAGARHERQARRRLGCRLRRGREPRRRLLPIRSACGSGRSPQRSGNPVGPCRLRRRCRRRTLRRPRRGSRDGDGLARWRRWFWTGVGDGGGRRRGGRCRKRHRLIAGGGLVAEAGQHAAQQPRRRGRVRRGWPRLSLGLGRLRRDPRAGRRDRSSLGGGGSVAGVGRCRGGWHGRGGGCSERCRWPRPSLQPSFRPGAGVSGSG